MPELPEVQTVVNDLQVIVDDTITDFWSDWPRALKTSDGKQITAKNFTELIKDKKIIAIERFGKNIFLKLSANLCLFIHLRMTGQLLLGASRIKSKDEEKYSKHIHHIFSLKNHGSLVFSDIRKFATIKVLSVGQANALKQTSGVDPLAKDFSLKVLQNLLAKKGKQTIKEFLMDQTQIAGIGNIYASEILFASKINPARKIQTLTIAEQKSLHSSIKKILRLAIKLRGTSVSDYRDSSGQKGGFQNMLMVYKKNKQKCKNCGTIIARSVIAQRSTFYCPTCQK